ncbi:hypothetical protein PGIGA_G00075460 [Pangasianodon gigas]|uniref:Uncharacterized protein n=1 Tax=Pangasianodon gigas TaxID=30993 RepID=A0ACC5X8H3_PANGG|nr:hypothetical protein [Pangasianodon gigas]
MSGDKIQRLRLANPRVMSPPTSGTSVSVSAALASQHSEVQWEAGAGLHHIQISTGLLAWGSCSEEHQHPRGTMF